MDANERIEGVVEEAVSRLKPDPELYLDVRAELRSHLEETIACYRAEGMDEEESLEHALKTFGPAEEVGEELFAANRRRMKLRALARIAIEMAFVPVAVLLAGVMCYHLWLRATNLAAVVKGDYAVSYNLERNLSYETVRLLKARGQDLWELEPGNKVYCAHYVADLVSEHQYGGVGNLSSELEGMLLEGEALDPDNALYNYVRAMLYLPQAFSVRGVPAQQEEALAEQLFISDAEKLAEALAELRKAQAKPIFKAYAHELALQKAALLDTSRGIEHKYGAMFVALGILAFDFHIDFIPEMLPSYAKHLHKANRPEDAELLMDSWRHQAVSLLAGVSSISESEHKIRWTIDNGSKRAIEFYESSKRSDKIEETQRFRAHLGALDESLKSEMILGADFLQKFKHMSVIAVSTLSLLPEIVEEKEVLEYERRIEQTITERLGAGIAAMALVVFGVMLGAVAWRWREPVQAATASLPNAHLGRWTMPLLLLPTWTQAIQIVVIGIVIPLGLYVASTMLVRPDMYPLTFLSRTVVEVLCLAMATIILTFWATLKAFHGRFKALGIATPPKPVRARLYVASALSMALFVALWILANYLPEPYGNSGFAVSSPVYVACSAAVMAFVFLIAPVLAMLRALQAPRALGAYHGIMARSLIPIFASLIIVMLAIVSPLLAAHEARLTHNDPFFKALAGSIGMGDGVRKMPPEVKEEIQELMDEIQGNPVEETFR